MNKAEIITEAQNLSYFNLSESNVDVITKNDTRKVFMYDLSSKSQYGLDVVDRVKMFATKNIYSLFMSEIYFEDYPNQLRNILNWEHIGELFNFSTNDQYQLKVYEGVKSIKTTTDDAFLSPSSEKNSRMLSQNFLQTLPGHNNLTSRLDIYTKLMTERKLDGNIQIPSSIKNNYDNNFSSLPNIDTIRNTDFFINLKFSINKNSSFIKYFYSGVNNQTLQKKSPQSMNDKFMYVDVKFTWDFVDFQNKVKR